jgi:hypothetical protein
LKGVKELEKPKLKVLTKEERQAYIHSQSFDLFNTDEVIGGDNTKFRKIKVGPKTLEDATVNLGTYKKINSRLGDKIEVMRAINNGDVTTMREISEFFFKTSGIYSRLCKYMAYLYRYDWVITPYTMEEDTNIEKVLKNFYKALNRFDNFGVKEFCQDVALKVVKRGCYYGYVIDDGNVVGVQELPPNYCRSCYSVNNKPAVEFNMKFFDEQFRNAELRERVIKLFPKEFAKGYRLYKQNKLRDEMGTGGGWYLLDINNAIKFNLGDADYPPFISVIPAIIDLDDAQNLDKQKAAQKLLKIIIQKLPLNKDNEMVFDPDEARDIHNNAVRMLGRAIGVDVLTTFADVEVADTDSSGTQTATDELERRERTVYNEAGVSQMQFNTDGNIALEKSILNDEATMYGLVLQLQNFLDVLLRPFNKPPKKMNIRAQILPTTIYNYKDMAKQFKEMTSLGFSKMRPMVALGQSQSSILADAYFENQVLQLYNILIPPLSTNVMNGDTLLNLGQGGDMTGKTQQQEKDGKKESEGVGRPELEDDQKSEKTIQNKESQS